MSGDTQGVLPKTSTLVSRRVALTGVGGIAALAAIGLDAVTSLSASAANNWSGYPNGQIPQYLMTDLGNGNYLEPLTAQCFLTMSAAAHAAGFAPLHINQAYRELGLSTDLPSRLPVTQWSAWNAYQSGIPLPGTHEVAQAADPRNGGTSNHGLGLAVDINGTSWHPDYNNLSIWFAANARTYGFEFDVPAESWHAHRKYAPLVDVGEGAPTQPPEEDEDEMAKTIVACTDIARIGGQTTDVSFVVFGPAPVGSPAVEVTTNHDRINNLLVARGKTISQFDWSHLPVLSFGQLTDVLQLEVGMPPMDGSAYVDGFRWPPAA